ncbi:porin [Vibrio sp. TRT 29B02]|uniref:porin n=1 Tax=Vibrio sp. TRT 29B02 TaxID=3418508 RepID=UPI003CE6EED0
MSSINSLNSAVVTAILILSALIPKPSSAQYNLNESIQLSGFGTLSAAKSDNATPVIDTRDITNEWCFDCDTTLGLQMDWLMGANFRSTVQVVKRPQDHFSSPEIERAFVEYAMGNARITAGRLRIPLFIMSEYYYVSSAYPWLRLPLEIYSNNLGITYYDGITGDMSYFIGDDLQLNISPFYALPRQVDYHYYGQSIDLDISRAIGLSSELYYGDNLVRFAYVNVDATEANTISAQSVYKMDMFSVGLSHYFDALHFQAEAILTKDISANWYAGLDYSLGKITPYIQYGQARVSRTSESYLVGFRYDWTPQINTSLEWQRFTGEQNVISGQFTQLQDPSKPLASKVDVVSAGVSFTF